MKVSSYRNKNIISIPVLYESCVEYGSLLLAHFIQKQKKKLYIFIKYIFKIQLDVHVNRIKQTYIIFFFLFCLHEETSKPLFFSNGLCSPKN